MRTLHIGAVADSATDRQRIAGLLKEAMPTVTLKQFSSPDEFLRSVTQERYDCLLIDFRLAGRDGLSLLSDLRRNPLLRKVPAYLLTTNHDVKMQERAIRHGAVGCLTRSRLGRDQLRRAVESAVAPKATQPRPTQEQAPHDTNVDRPSGLPSPAMFHARVQELLQAEPQKPFSLFVLSLDRFQSINDRFGRGAGDTVLKEIGQRLLRHQQEGEEVFRLPAREFGVLHLGDQEQTALKSAAERIASPFFMPIVIRAGANYVGSCSLGIARFPEHGQTHDSLVKAALNAMHAAAQTGSGIQFASVTALKSDPAAVSRTPG